MTLLIVLPIFAASGCASARPSRESEYTYLCGARFASYNQVRDFLAGYGIETIWLGSSLLCDEVCVRGGREAAFCARMLLQEHAEEQSFNIGWIADALIAPAPAWLIVANVEFARTPSEAVLERLEREGIATEIYFGARVDKIAVSSENYARALEIVREGGWDGVTAP